MLRSRPRPLPAVSIPASADAGPSSAPLGPKSPKSPTSPSSKLSSLQRLRRTFAVAGRRASRSNTNANSAGGPSIGAAGTVSASNGDPDPYDQLQPAGVGPPDERLPVPVMPAARGGRVSRGTAMPDLVPDGEGGGLGGGWGAGGEGAGAGEDMEGGEGYEWEEETESGEDAYSWVDPSVVGTERLGRTPAPGASTAEGLDMQRLSMRSPLGTTPPRLPDRPMSYQPLKSQPPPGSQPPLSPEESYNLLLSFQMHQSSSSPFASAPTSQDTAHQTSSQSQSHSHSQGHHPGRVSDQSHQTRASHTAQTPSSSTESHKRVISSETEWYQIVDAGLVASLPKEEQKRQGMWWELIKAEKEYVRDLSTLLTAFVEPLKTHDPPILIPEPRLHAFIAEVFSSINEIHLAHTKLLHRLMDRQRNEWPLLTSATDLFLGILLEALPAYEVYMKNYPFADSRVRREKGKNPAFRSYLQERHSHELTDRRDLTVFLSRPVNRLTRLLLLLEGLVKYTPADHPDREELPTLIHVLTQAVKGSQPGIESAEAKIKLWNLAERLLFKKGEIVELDMGDPKRSLVYSGYVFRRIRSETSWHGWQDLHAFLLDNYFLLTRDEEHGRHVVVSRPIPLDFLTVISFDGAPERRSDFMNQWRNGTEDAPRQPARLMWPFTIATSPSGGGRTYTLCAGTQQGREAWRDKIEQAKSLRQFDLDSNGIFATHFLATPNALADPILSADAFQWLGRRTVAIATPRSVYFGWRNDSSTFRELIRLQTGVIRVITVVPDFGWLLVLTSGTLVAFDLREMMPASDPATWVQLGRVQARDLSDPERMVQIVRIGFTKGRLLVVHASHSRNSTATDIMFDEPLLPSSSPASTGPHPPSRPFRRFATLHLPGYATDFSFFRQTIAAVTDKGFIIAEPGNPEHNVIPTFPPELGERNVAPVMGMIGSGTALEMYQVKENEFMLVYNWGACYVTKYGEISRNGAYLRWNLTPSYAIFHPPHVLLFDESGGRAEVRDVDTGKVCEVVDMPGLKPVHLPRVDAEVLGLTKRGLVHLVETVAL